MRVWDIPPQLLCKKHLIAQHHEIHCIWNIITQNKKGFAKHPEVMRWREHLGALLLQHYYTAQTMLTLGIKHNSNFKTKDWLGDVG